MPCRVIAVVCSKNAGFLSTLRRSPRPGPPTPSSDPFAPLHRPSLLPPPPQLTALGIQPASISFQTLTLESDSFICVRDQANVVIVDLNDANAVVRRPITADSALMHPKEKILALKAGRQLQVFNIASKQKLKAHLMNEEVVFWKWINTETLGVVTESAVFHWDLNGAEAPVKVRHLSPW